MAEQNISVVEPYKGKGTYKDKHLSDFYKSIISYLGDVYEQAQAAGDKSGMEAAHNQAEKIRAKHGYSGGPDGSEYIFTGDVGSENTYLVNPIEIAGQRLKENLYSRLFDEYTKSLENSVYVNPYNEEYAQKIMDSYKIQGMDAADKEISSGLGENSGHLDSFALANAQRQQLSFTNAANNAILNQYNATAKNAYNLYKELAAAVADN